MGLFDRLIVQLDSNTWFHILFVSVLVLACSVYPLESCGINCSLKAANIGRSLTDWLNNLSWWLERFVPISGTSTFDHQNERSCYLEQVELTVAIHLIVCLLQPKAAKLTTRAN